MTRIGLTQRVVEVADYGERRDCLDQAWTLLLEGIGFDPILLPNRLNAATTYVDSLDLDGFILTSGNDLTAVENPSVPAPERDQFERSILDYAIDSQTPVLGICRGLELLNDYFGGDLVHVDGHVAADHRVDFTSTADLDFLPTTATVNSYHDYGIDQDRLANELTAFAHAPDGSIEGVFHEEFLLWGIMWHPERDQPVTDLDQQLIKHVFEETNQ